MGRQGNRNINSCKSFITGITLCLGLTMFTALAKAQCPPNIDFEQGDFNGWTCWVGSVADVGGTNVISLVSTGGPAGDQHTMYGDGDPGTLDYYGGFPVLSPNGSRRSVKLGNTSGGAQAEGLSYEFTIPSNRNTYTLIYQYAVVFQDPNHQPQQQPRLELEITNVTDNVRIDCSSFTFFPNGSPLPGFFVSPQSDSTPVWCKNWSPVSINLNGQAGKTIRLFFKTADCTFRRHFGYAYIDVNTECSAEFNGATYCPDDTTVTVTAPWGYQNYTWYNSTFTQVLGTQQTISFTPPPPPGTTLAVEIVPYDGYGCRDTLYANMIDTLKLFADAGPDVTSCNQKDVYIGSLPKNGVNYSWTPITGLSNPIIANPRASPAVTTQYIVNVRSNGGGCRNADTVVVKASFIDTSMQLIGKSLFCINTGDSAVLRVQPGNSIQWYRNTIGIAGAIQPAYKVNQSGDYYAILSNTDGCMEKTRTEKIQIESPRPGIRYPLQYAIINIPAELQARTFGINVQWKPSFYLNDPFITNPLFTASAELDQSYTIDIRTAAGCLTVDSQTVRVIKEVKVYVPTGFTPNNDGRNDYIRPIMLGIKELKYFRIYHRWGQLVYDYNSSNERGWDGKIGGELQPTGVYVWIFSGTGWDKKEYIQKGTLVLIR